VNRLNEIPSNFHLTASRGGKCDDLIEKHNLKNVKVCFSKEEALAQNLDLDHDDSHAYDASCKQFGLLIHGTQKAKSQAMAALNLLKKQGVKGYSTGNYWGKKKH
jgi:hypothetical protein